MIDMNTIIAKNIHAIMQKQNKKQNELVQALDISQDAVSQILNGTHTFNLEELKAISQFLGIEVKRIVDISPGQSSDNAISRAFMGKVTTDSARDTLDIVETLSDMIVYHKRIRQNGVAMMQPWGDD
ncbi:XRE family transcriptional regulator [Anaerovibrio lipolyticus]|uniref:XRE family transcriptional regulator n=1 Tax=Anaerovibrio lipolyticus TaxID=82374 RepID=A0A0B2K161_9FIRM|nr:helix-turn-helix transcriptional regulator [Anaerovibrio lipolyticus]KHM52653.1 XRE family transcriptional regulator [Anaerovibrio lipolyticus]